jgi:fucose permease
VSLRLHFLLVMPVMLVLSVLATRWWTDHRVVDADLDRHTAGTSARAKTVRVLTVPIILIGIMTMCSTLREGAASDWLALYLHDDRGVSQGLAALIFTTYTVALTLGRFSGGGVLQRFGRVDTLRLSGCVTAAGIVATVVVPGIGGPFLGAILWGLGLSVVFPVAVTAAGDVGGKNAAGAISAVSTIAYGSFLAGPPLIGILAQDLSIGIALWFVAIMALGITLLAPFTNPRRLRTPAG